MSRAAGATHSLGFFLMMISLIDQKGRGGEGWKGFSADENSAPMDVGGGGWRWGFELALFETGESRLVESMAVAMAAFCTLHQHWCVRMGRGLFSFRQHAWPRRGGNGWFDSLGYI